MIFKIFFYFFHKYEIKEFGIKSPVSVMLHLKRIRRKQRGNISWRKQRKGKEESGKKREERKQDNKSSIRVLSAPPLAATTAACPSEPSDRAPAELDVAA